MSPKMILWLVVSLAFGSWYAFDPDVGHPFRGAQAHAVGVTGQALAIDPSRADQ
jgi:hypothetical protein